MKDDNYETRSRFPHRPVHGPRFSIIIGTMVAVVAIVVIIALIASS